VKLPGASPFLFPLSAFPMILTNFESRPAMFAYNVRAIAVVLPAGGPLAATSAHCPDRKQA
jgi:hypothetical protein